MFSSFHHFRAAEAREVLANAAECRKGIAIFEMARREPQTVLAICFVPILILFLTPQISPFRWSRLLWTYVLPVVSFVLWFDGWMSCLRSYSHEQLRELVRSLSCETYRWELGTQRDGFLPVTSCETEMLAPRQLLYPRRMGLSLKMILSALCRAIPFKDPFVKNGKKQQGQES